jgi:hypothetical protein
VVELDSRARAALARRYPELAGYGSAAVVVSDAEAAAGLLEAITALVDSINEGQRVAVEQLVQEVAPPVDVATPDALEQADREAHQRSRILRDFGAWRAHDLPAAKGGSRGADRSATAYRWRREGRVLGVHHEGTLWFLGFQFDAGGAPLPVVAEILRALDGWTDWEKAAWFVRPNGCLDLRRPVDLLVEDPTSVLAAAERDGTRRPV